MVDDEKETEFDICSLLPYRAYFRPPAHRMLSMLPEIGQTVRGGGEERRNTQSDDLPNCV